MLHVPEHVASILLQHIQNICSFQFYGIKYRLLYTKCMVHRIVTILNDQLSVISPSLHLQSLFKEVGIYCIEDILVGEGGVLAYHKQYNVNLF